MKSVRISDTTWIAISNIAGFCKHTNGGNHVLVVYLFHPIGGITEYPVASEYAEGVFEVLV